MQNKKEYYYLCENKSNKMPNINQYNYYTNTLAIFKGCKVPKRKPDFISHSKHNSCYYIPTNEIKQFIIKSEYNYITLNDEGITFLTETYGIPLKHANEIKRGYNDKNKECICFDCYPISSKYWYTNEYVIRASNHWVNITNFENKGVKFDCNSIASCMWHLKTNNTNDEVKGGKCYFKDFKVRE